MEKRLREEVRRPAGERAQLEMIRGRVGTGGGGRFGVRLGIGDDCALLRIRADEEMAVTTDLSIEGRHFKLDWHSAEAIGHRSLARGLSDLAAMGARPVAAFLSLGLPKELTSAAQGGGWVERFYDGLLALASEFKVPLAGGDLAESPLAIADIVLIGAVPRGRALLRSCARVGDRIFVTGSLGGSAAELKELSEEPLRFSSATSDQEHPHLYPQPRVAQGLWLRRRGLASAAMDLSDGLSTDLNHLCEESGAAALIDAATLPLGVGATLEMALHGGEDYELLFTAPPEAKIPRRIGGVACTAIGLIGKARRNGERVVLRTLAGLEPLKSKGWEHFNG